MRFSTRFCAMLVAIAGVCAPPAIADDTAYSIGFNAPVVSADPTAEAPCRTRVRFIGTVTFGREAGPDDLHYHIRYSDGSTGDDMVVKHQAANLSSQTLDIRTFYAAADGWAELEFVSPVKLTTVRRDFHVTCQPLATVVSVGTPTVTVAPAPLPDLPCRQAMQFEDTISAPDLDPALPRVVTYRFERSDTTLSKTYTHTFTTTTSKTAHDTWNLFTAAHGWERLEVLTPTHLYSAKGTFTTSCSGKAQTSGPNLGNVSMNGSSFDVAPGAGACAFTIDFHTTIDASHWPGTDRTLRYRAVWSNGKIFAHVLPNFAGPLLVHSQWKVHAPFKGTVRFEITAPNTLKGKDVVAELTHC